MTYTEKRLEEFDEEFPLLHPTYLNVNINDMHYLNKVLKSFIARSIQEAEREVVKAMFMEGREAKMTPFQTTVNQYLRNRAEEIGIDISHLQDIEIEEIPQFKGTMEALNNLTHKQ